MSEFLKSMYDKVSSGKDISHDEVMKLWNEPLEELCDYADKLREFFCGNYFDICTIINGKSGRCSENCRFCAQSAHNVTNIEKYDLLDEKVFFEDSQDKWEKGVKRYSIVTSGRSLSYKEIEQICDITVKIKRNIDIGVCVSAGLLSQHQFENLRKAGVTRVHNNLETSREYFSSICTTHSYDDKISAIKAAQSAGIEVCSGGIIGMGESREDRVNMAYELKKLKIKSVPVNILNPIKGTPMENTATLPENEVRRTIAVFRFILPKVCIRMAGGRGILDDKGRSCFKAGANGAISGDMLTTAGISIESDLKMIAELGFIAEKI